MQRSEDDVATRVHDCTRADIRRDSRRDLRAHNRHADGDTESHAYAPCFGFGIRLRSRGDRDIVACGNIGTRADVSRYRRRDADACAIARNADDAAAHGLCAGGSLGGRFGTDAHVTAGPDRRIINIGNHTAANLRAGHADADTDAAKSRAAGLRTSQFDLLRRIERVRDVACRGHAAGRRLHRHVLPGIHRAAGGDMTLHRRQHRHIRKCTCPTPDEQTARARGRGRICTLVQGGTVVRDVGARTQPDVIARRHIRVLADMRRYRRREHRRRHRNAEAPGCAHGNAECIGRRLHLCARVDADVFQHRHVGVGPDIGLDLGIDICRRHRCVDANPEPRGHRDCQRVSRCDRFGSDLHAADGRRRGRCTGGFASHHRAVDKRLRGPVDARQRDRGTKCGSADAAADGLRTHGDVRGGGYPHAVGAGDDRAILDIGLLHAAVVDHRHLRADRDRADLTGVGTRRGRLIQMGGDQQFVINVGARRQYRASSDVRVGVAAQVGHNHGATDTADAGGHATGNRIEIDNLVRPNRNVVACLHPRILANERGRA